MSRPYININSMSYATASSVLTMNYTVYKLRGGNSMVLSGFTNNITFNELLSNEPSLTLTFSVSPTQSTGTYNFSILSSPLGAYDNYTLTF